MHTLPQVIDNEKINNQSLIQFLEKWDNAYSKSVLEIPLFDTNQTSKWTMAQKQYFVKTFYHIRGHFHEFLWFMGNFAPNKQGKDMILKNIIDELGDRGMSHEKLYHLFAEALEVDLTNEMIDGDTYLPFIKDFNKGYIRWLSTKDWSTRVSAFAALERLDQVDYANTKSVAESIGVKGTGLTFFNVHMNSKHFEHVLMDEFCKIWENEQIKAEYAFNFVGEYQAKAWRRLSDEIFNYTSIS